MRGVRSSLAAVAVAAVTMLAVAGCGSSGGSSSGGGSGGGSTGASGAFDTQFASLITQAKAEGTLTWYEGLSADGGTKYAADFQKRFGIQVQVVFNATGPLQQRFESEEQAGRGTADVLSLPDSAAMTSVMQAGLAAPYTIAENSAYPAGYVLDVNGATAYPTARVQMAVAYNTQLVDSSAAAALKDWNGILQPSLKGKLGLADATKIGSYYTTAYMWNTESRFGDTFLTSLGNQKPVIYSGQTEEGQRLAAGEISAGVMVDQIAILNYSNGSPVAWTYPSPTPQTLEYSTIVKSAPHPAAAKLFMEYTHDREGALVWAKAWGGYLGRPDLDKDLTFKFTTEPWYHAATDPYLLPAAATNATTKASTLKSVTSHFK